MTVKEVRVCDVFGTAKDVQRYSVTMTPVDDEGEPINDDVFSMDSDLSPRAVERAKKFIDRAMAGPPQQ